MIYFKVVAIVFIWDGDKSLLEAHLANSLFERKLVLSKIDDWLSSDLESWMEIGKHTRFLEMLIFLCVVNRKIVR